MRQGGIAKSDGRAALIAALALGSAMILGGGGSPGPLAELAVQLIVGTLFCLWLVWFPELAVRRAPLRPALVLCALLVFIPLVQLVPLPPGLWHALPGRALERDALGLIGEADSWRPLSLAPARTLASLLAVIPPAIMLLLTATLGPAGRATLVGTIAGVTLLAVVVGAAQASGGAANPLRFYVPEAGSLNGFQANHNSSADVLLIGMVAFATTVMDWAERRPTAPSRQAVTLLVATGVALLSIGVFLTGSRAGAALLPVAWLAIALLTRPLWRGDLRWAVLGVVVVIGVAVAGAVQLRSNAIVGGVLARYGLTAELRPQIWLDSLFAARTYFPVGAGMGAFLPVFLAAERLEAVHPAVPNRAHNDLLELAIEAGALGFIVLAAATAILARLAVQQLRDPSPRIRRHGIFAVATFTVVALHSQVDYPLRSLSLACIAAASAGLLVPVARGPQSADDTIEN